MTQCVFPRGLLNGRCVECPVDTLFEYVESYTYQFIQDNRCSPKHPFINSTRICISSCSGSTMQAGQRKYCDDENINNGFCNVNYCPLNDFKCYYMQCFTRMSEFHCPL